MRASAYGVEVEDDDARGGPAAVLARGLLGTRFTGSVSAIRDLGEKD